MEQALSHDDYAQNFRIEEHAFGFVQFLLVILVFIVLGIGIFYTLLKMGAQDDIELLDAHIIASEEQIANLQISESVYQAKKALLYVNKRSFSWSDIISDIHALSPASVRYRSYTGDESGRITLSVVSDSFLGAAKLIRIFSENSAFRNVFVPALSKGVASDGDTVVTFTMYLDYQEKSSKKVSRI